MITIIDYGIGNLGSIENMFKYLNIKCEIARDQEGINQADKILLPGVGSFDTAIKALRDRQFIEILNHKALIQKVPILGICLGMQLLTKSSEEGSLPGLGWINAETKRFPTSELYKVPHMGWSEVELVNPSSLVTSFNKRDRFYFVHSYYVRLENKRDCTLRAKHGITFDAVCSVDNIFGAQFHPEKSHKFGMKIFNNFARL